MGRLRSERELGNIGGGQLTLEMELVLEHYMSKIYYQ